MNSFRTAAAFGRAMLLSCLLLMFWQGAEAAADGGAEDAIRSLMKTTWERPDAPLKVAFVTVEGDYAVAGWIFEGQGGRALLIRHDGLWEVRLCGGDGLVKPDSIHTAGAPHEVAAKLAAHVAEAEAALSEDDRSKLSLFHGLVEIAPGAAHATGGYHEDGHQKP
jgi:hypothetical protein